MADLRESRTDAVSLFAAMPLEGWVDAQLQRALGVDPARRIWPF